MSELDRYGNEIERVRPDRPAPPPPLARDELKAVIDAVVAYTKIPPDKTMVQVWAVQSELGRWTAPEAIRAIHLWGMNRKQGEFLEPSDVTRAIRAERQDAALRAEQARLAATPADPASAERINQIVGELAQQLGWSEDSVDRTNFALKVRCPHCAAAQGVRCIAPSTGKALTKSACHPSRAEALAELLRGGAA